MGAATAQTHTGRTLKTARLNAVVSPTHGHTTTQTQSKTHPHSRRVNLIKKFTIHNNVCVCVWVIKLTDQSIDCLVCRLVQSSTELVYSSKLNNFSQLIQNTAKAADGERLKRRRIKKTALGRKKTQTMHLTIVDMIIDCGWSMFKHHGGKLVFLDHCQSNDRLLSRIRIRNVRSHSRRNDLNERERERKQGQGLKKPEKWWQIKRREANKKPKAKLCYKGHQKVEKPAGKVISLTWDCRQTSEGRSGRLEEEEEEEVVKK